MDDNNNKLQKTPGPSSEGPQGTAITPSGGVKISGKSRLHSALAGANAPKSSAEIEEGFKKAAEAAVAHSPDKVRDPLTAENRIAIMADCSGSMSEQASGNNPYSSHGTKKIDLLQQALVGFINQVNFDTTSVAIYTFPMNYREEELSAEERDPEFTATFPTGTGVKYKLSFDKLLLTYAAQSLRASGGTPMHSTMQKVLQEIPLTRGIIISDGEADQPDTARMNAHDYTKSETIVDCVHIGDSSSGEQLLQDIAKITGGIYIKFDNVQNFAKAFAFLTPEGRATLILNAGAGATLEQKEAAARMLGAKEIK